jgi:hypothetical protein
VEHLRLDTPVDGRVFRVLITSAETFRLHGVQARVRPIGEYIDGTVGDRWESAEVSFA